MATPVVQTTSGSAVNSVASPASVTLPSGIAAGDLLIVFFFINNSRTVATPAGWSLLAGSPTSLLYGFTRVADGSEGATLSLTTSGTASNAYTAYRISGAGATPVMTSFVGGGTAFPNPPLNTPGGVKDWLWLEVAASVPGYATTALSAGYSNLVAGWVASSNLAVGSGQKATTGSSSEDPGTMTLSSASNYVVWTVAVAPIPTQALSGIGAIASAEAFGAAAVAAHYAISAAGAIASAEAFGTAAIAINDPNALGVVGGIASTEAFGSASVNPGPVALGLAGVAPAEAFGAAALTARYGVSAVGAIPPGEAFGAASVLAHDPAPAKLRVFIDWDGDGVFDAGDEVTADLRADIGVEWSHGRSADFSTDATGAASFTLKNIGASLDSPGPYAPEVNANLVPGRPVLIKSTYAMVERAHFFGFIQRVTPNAADFSVTITCYDPLQLLSDTDVIVPGTTRKRTCGELRQLVLAEAERGSLNMVANPSFEGATMDTWITSGGGTFTLDPANHWTGSWSMRIDTTSDGATAVAPGYMAPVTYAGQPYTGSVYLKAAVAGTVVMVGLGFVDNPSEVNRLYVLGTAWKRYSMSYTPAVTKAPSDNTNQGFLALAVTVFAPGATVYVDAASITRGGALRPYADAGSGYWPNWVSNGTFEDDGSGWAGIGGASVAAASTRAHTGAQSLRVDTPGTTPYGASYQFSSAGCMFAKGRQYTVSVWVYSVTDLPYTISLGVYSHISSNASGTVAGGAWTKVECSLTSDGNYFASDLYVEFKQSDTLARTWWIDDARLTPGPTVVDTLPQWAGLRPENDLYIAGAALSGSALSALKKLNELSLSRHYLRATLTAPYWEYVLSTRDDLAAKTVAESFDNTFHGFTAADVDRDAIVNVLNIEYDYGDAWYSDADSVGLYGPRPGSGISGADFFHYYTIPDALGAALLARYSQPRARPSMTRVNKNAAAQQSILERELDDLVELNLDRLGIAGKKYLIVSTKTTVKGMVWTATWGLEEHAF
jgi:hypothetical protein